VFFYCSAAGAVTGRIACAPRSGATSLLESGERMTITKRAAVLSVPSHPRELRAQFLGPGGAAHRCTQHRRHLH
jgi:hypothetical protein